MATMWKKLMQNSTTQDPRIMNWGGNIDMKDIPSDQAALMVKNVMYGNPRVFSSWTHVS
jgi:hypothetical protein